MRDKRVRSDNRTFPAQNLCCSGQKEKKGKHLLDCMDGSVPGSHNLSLNIHAREFRKNPEALSAHPHSLW